MFQNVTRKEVSRYLFSEFAFLRRAPIAFTAAVVVAGTGLYMLVKEDRQALKDMVHSQATHLATMYQANQHLQAENKRIAEELKLLKAQPQAPKSKVGDPTSDARGRAEWLDPAPLGKLSSFSEKSIVCAGDEAVTRFIICPGRNGSELYVRADALKRWAVEFASPKTNEPLDIKSPAQKADVKREQKQPIPR